MYDVQPYFTFELLKQVFGPSDAVDFVQKQLKVNTAHTLIPFMASCASLIIMGSSKYSCHSSPQLSNKLFFIEIIVGMEIYLLNLEKKPKYHVWFALAWFLLIDEFSSI